MLDLKEAEKKLYKFSSELVSNRVFDVYLKYMGIKTLTSATLVPVALILGKDAMERYLRETSETDTEDLLEGGSSIENRNIVVIDDPLVGNYLKLAGLSALDVTVNTLVPLGVLMVIYHLYQNQLVQDGGNLNKFVKKTYGNRALDLFFKYQGIKTLTSTTLVPFALIFGKDLLETVLRGEEPEQVGGTQIHDTLKKTVPFIDDPIIGNYLKLAGISTLNLAPNTLVPLGLVALIYSLYIEKE